jgi:hypothetical protein
MDTIFNGKHFGLAAAAAAALAINLALGATLGHLPTRGQQWLAMAARADEVRLAARSQPLIDPDLTLVKATPPAQKAPIHLGRLVTCDTRPIAPAARSDRARHFHPRSWQAGLISRE